MKKKKGKDDFIKKHEYPGGKEAFSVFVKANLVYPKEALEQKIEGDVFVEYEVGFDGKVRNAKVLHGIGYGCDDEILRLVKLLKFAPQNNHGTKLSSKHKIKFNFKLPTLPVQKKETIIKYDLTETSTENKEKGKNSLSYTITLKHP